MDISCNFDVKQICNSSAMPKVSVIVPVYNVAAYIEKCAESLFSQTLDDMEIIFVDDCSPDDSVKIINNTLKKYEHRIPQTRVLRPEVNGGLAAARRIGLQAATGDYVAHCDGDDWVDPDLYEKMYDEAVSRKADIVMCGEILEFATSQIKKESAVTYRSGRDRVHNWYRDTRSGMFVHDKLIKRSVYTDNNILPWPGLDMWEDNALITRVYYFAGNISSVSGTYYHYNRSNTKSMTAGYGIKQVREMIDVAQKLTEFFESQPDHGQMRLSKLAFQYLAKINLVTDSFERLKEFHTIFPESDEVLPYIPLHSFSTAGKIRFLMVKYHLARLFVVLYKCRTLISRGRNGG